MGEGLHELSLEKTVTLELLQDGYEVEKVLSSLYDPPDIHDFHCDFSVDHFFFTTATEKLFLTQAVIGSHLDLSLIEMW